MKGITHITLSLATLLVILAPFTRIIIDIGLASVLMLLFIVLGVFFGSITPDVDLGKKSAVFHSEIPGAKGRRFFLTPVFGYIVCYTVYYPVRAFFVLIFGKKIYAKEGHRELPHSPLGCICMAILLTVYIWLICFGLSFIPGLFCLFNNLYIFIFGGSFLLGCFMHLIEDTCDFAGIHYLYPFIFRRLRGKLQGNGKEIRPRVYGLILLITAVVLCVLSVTGRLYGYEVIAAFAVPVILWIIFMLVSGVPAKKQSRGI